MKKKLEAALKDKKFMAGVWEAQAEMSNGGRGKPWSQVQRELGLEV